MLKYIASFFILIIIALLGVFYIYKSSLSEQAVVQGSITVNYQKGESIDEIASELEQKKLVESALFFKTYALASGLARRFQAGEYVFSSGATIENIAKTFAGGKVALKEKKITMIEGWNVRDMNNYLKEEKIINDDSFKDLAEKDIGDWSFKFSKPEIFSNLSPDQDLEGYLFPDTYIIYEDAKAEDVIAKMIENFSEKISPQMLDDIKSQGKTLTEIITMASIIEKEVRKAEDMEIVSGIFWDRIKNSQRLESCATLAYILGQNKAQYSVEDTNIPSPYNTYRNDGLPPGPIANPGLTAIRAAIYPNYTDYNYFLTDSKTGETIFSKTFEEHVRNKAIHL